MQGTRVPRLVAYLLATCVLAAVACLACNGGHGDHGPAWDRQLSVKGRQRSLLSFRGRRCGVAHLDPAEMLKLEMSLARFRAVESALAKPLPSVNGTRVYRIKTWVTVVVMDDGTGMGNVSDAAVMAQLDRLNSAYSTGKAGSGLAWYFDLQGIRRVLGSDMCDTANEAKMKAMHRRGVRGDYNLFITDLSACGLLGFSTWPWDLSKNPTLDGVTIHYDTLPLAGRYAPYNMGITAVHETGHWMGLFHTFQNGCSKGGDLVDDTPYTASPTEGCPNWRDTCPEVGADPIHNFMDYTDDKCMREFTALQQSRMEAVWARYRTPLSDVALKDPPSGWRAH